MFCSADQSKGPVRHFACRQWRRRSHLPSRFCERISVEKKSVGLTLRDVQGNPLSHHGTRHVNLSVGTGGQRANTDFQIANISDNMLSKVKLLRNWFVFKLRGETDSIMYHQRDPTTTVPFFLQKNSLRIGASPIVHHVSPVMEEDMPVRLSAQAPLRHEVGQVDAS